jgi:hypothetical protein
MMNPRLVIPAKAGIHLFFFSRSKGRWTPAFVGVTKKGGLPADA